MKNDPAVKSDTLQLKLQQLDIAMVMRKPEIIAKLEKAIETSVIYDTFLYYPTGSAFTCSPPSTTTDEDWIVWCDEPHKAQEVLVANGFKTSPEQREYPDCMSYRDGALNVIVIFEIGMFKDWIKATKVCAALNLLCKEERKLVHRVICGEV